MSDAGDRARTRKQPHAFDPFAGPDHDLEVELGGRPAIGPPKAHAERRNSPTIELGPPATRTASDPDRPTTLVMAAGLLGNSTMLPALRDRADIEVVGFAVTASDAHTTVVEHLPDVAVLGLELASDAGAVREVIDVLAEDAPSTRLVVVADADGPAGDASACVLAGAVACIALDDFGVDLAGVVRGVRRQQAVVTPAVAQEVLAAYERLAVAGADFLATPPQLGEEERRMLELLGTGASAEQVAAQEEVLTRDVGRQVANALVKLQRARRDHRELAGLRRAGTAVGR